MPVADYVIVGAGSAGCVVANRLSEDPDVTVLLIEAGGKGKHLNIAIPAAFANQFKTKLDWDLASEPEPHLNGRSLFLPRGKALGGCSSMNAMLYVRGRPLDYDLWDVPGWGWNDVLPYFVRSENNQRGASDLHGTGGPLEVRDQVEPRPLTQDFLTAAEQTGIPRNPDYNGGEQDGAAISQVTQRNGRRWSTNNAYLQPAADRKNLTIVTSAQVMKVETANGRALGVRYVGKRGREEVAHASREVVLCAGAFGSPQLLMLSGIGPAEHLRQHGIDVAVDSAEVGENLQDHPFVGLVWEATQGSLKGADSLAHTLQWATRRNGPLTSPVAEAFAFVRSRPGLPAADLQFHFAPGYFNDHGFDKSFEGHAFAMAPTLITPKSRGRLSLRSADPSAKPRILTNSLAEPEDMAALVAGIKQGREIASAPALAASKVREMFPGDAVQTDDDIAEDIRNRVELLYHPVGTCRMGTDDQSVVDPELRVRGIEGLRVIDASIMPLIPGGNTNAPTIMIGEMGADLIRGRVGAGVPA